MVDLNALGGTAVNAIGTVAVTKIAADTINRSTRGLGKTPTRKVTKTSSNSSIFNGKGHNKASKYKLGFKKF